VAPVAGTHLVFEQQRKNLYSSRAFLSLALNSRAGSQFDSGCVKTLRLHANRLRRRSVQIDDPAAHEGAAIVDGDHDRSAPRHVLALIT
jgi:hypothetical protein